MNKYLGAIILLLSLFGAIFGILALIDTNDLSQLLALFAGESDINGWQQHWKLSVTFLLICCCGGIVAGIGIVKNKQWAYLLFACILSLLIITQILLMLFGNNFYKFEKMNTHEFIVYFLICIIAWVMYFRRKKVT